MRDSLRDLISSLLFYAFSNSAMLMMALARRVSKASKVLNSGLKDRFEAKFCISGDCQQDIVFNSLLITFETSRGHSTITQFSEFVAHLCSLDVPLNVLPNDCNSSRFLAF